ncbi:MAG TPA: class I SAM-dependent DNA methyltransferase [Opitutaceae bacterium]|nr:class I SAM-dependent DNA methyltransferase [Opitutaceae bacterium]
MSPDLRSRLDRITNLLFAGGVNDPITYIEQISYLIYLKLLDEVENERELQARLTGQHTSLFPQQAARYRWSQWRFLSGDKLLKFVRDEVFPYLGSLVKEEPDVAAYFQDARLQIEDANVLKEVVDEIDHIAFARLGTDVKGDIFEYLLQYLATQEGALLGQFRTPRQIRKLMVEVTDPDLGDTIHDPACGTGGFIIDAIEHILAKYSSAPVEVPIYGESWLEKEGVSLEQAKKKNPALQTYRKGPGDLLPDWGQLEASLFGHDVSSKMVRIARMNLVLHGFPRAKLRRANTLSDLGGLTEDDLARRYKVILSNPPFAGMLPRDSIRSDLPTNSKKSELLFLAVMMQALAPGGRCAVVAPEGLLFGSTAAHLELRKKLVTDFNVQAVVSLPAGVFKPYAGVKTSILVFRRPSDAGKKQPEAGKNPPHVWFYEIAADGYDPEKVSGGGRPQTPERNDIPEFLQRWRDYKTSGFTNPWGARGLQLLPADHPEPKSWWATLEQIEQADWTLSASRYKPQRVTAVNEDDPRALIRAAIKTEVAITKGLEALFAKLEPEK